MPLLEAHSACAYMPTTTYTSHRPEDSELHTIFWMQNWSPTHHACRG